MLTTDVAMKPPVISKAGKSDLIRLLPVARFIFSATFGGRFEAEELARFCDRVYALDGTMAADFDSPKIDWFIAKDGDLPVGYAKLTPLRTPHEAASPRSLELQQIYVLPQWHGKGVAEELMQRALAAATSRGAPELYLTVFDFNERATRFYARHHFRKVGTCPFTLGQTVVEDGIWSRPMGAT